MNMNADRSRWYRRIAVRIAALVVLVALGVGAWGMTQAAVAHAAPSAHAIQVVPLTCTNTIGASPNYVSGESGYNTTFHVSWNGCNGSGLYYSIKTYWGQGNATNTGALGSSGNTYLSHIYTVCYRCTQDFTVEFILYYNGPSGPVPLVTSYATANISWVPD